jgi:hypothetical protein
MDSTKSCALLFAIVIDSILIKLTMISLGATMI